MRLRNWPAGYGVAAIFFHWLTALVVIGLFGLGLWMVDLTYYDAWYQKAPDLHRGVGILLAVAVVLRLCLRIASGMPNAIETHAPWERVLARVAHLAMYGLLFVMFASGYLISTAKGQAIEVLGLFEVPASIHGVANLEDFAGSVHEWVAYVLISTVVLHAAAALKHHFFDRDDTLRRMLGRAVNIENRAKETQ